jgi:hypothetical protein
MFFFRKGKGITRYVDLALRDRGDFCWRLQGAFIGRAANKKENRE